MPCLSSGSHCTLLITTPLYNALETSRQLSLRAPLIAGERLTTLDGVEHVLDDFTVLVCDNAGALSIAGVMGGAESEVSATTRNILLEGAAWNYINVRRTIASQRMSSEAAYRFSRGVHPAMAEVVCGVGLS